MISNLYALSEGSRILGLYIFKGKGPFLKDFIETPSKARSPYHLPVTTEYFLIASYGFIPSTDLLFSTFCNLYMVAGEI
jgi:hypothetical protein